MPSIFNITPKELQTAFATAANSSTGFNKDYLKFQIKKIYGPDIKSKEDAFNQWNKGLSDYIAWQNVGGFTPTEFTVNLFDSFNASANSNSFIVDFGKNIELWAKGINWSNGKDTKPSTTPATLDFASFSDQHKNDIDVDKYQDALSVFLHDWFSKITVSN
jgi:hypothetical protein